MACPSIITGDQFLTRMIAHIDCQAQFLGSYGYQALGQPGSLASTVMAGMLTLFVALFGIRLLFGHHAGARDVVNQVLLVGIALTLAFSWPAFRTVVHDVVLSGPGEIAASMTSPGLSHQNQGFVERLQSVDNAIVQLTERGTGRNTGQFVDGEAPGGTFEASALEDESTLGLARLAWLAGIIGALALLRLLAGLLLALAPLVAGLLLFPATGGIFSGWLRGLVLALIGSVGLTLVLSVELAVLEPWLADALRLRQSGYATPSAPIELLAMTLGFAIVQFGMIALMTRLAWTRGWVSMPSVLPSSLSQSPTQAFHGHAAASYSPPDRVARLSENIEVMVRREELGGPLRVAPRALITSAANDGPLAPQGSIQGQTRLGSSWRRQDRRMSLAAGRRDGVS